MSCVRFALPMTDARDRHQPPDVWVTERVFGDDPIDCRELVAVKIELAQAPVKRQPLVDRQLLLGQPRAALDAEHVAHRRTSLEVAMQHRGRLVLDLRAALD
jgi:hypothetical protein